jgi:hypothetical protein
MTAACRQLLRALPAVALLALGCQGGDESDQSGDRERIRRVVASYVSAYLDGRGDDACSFYTGELRARIEREGRRRGVRGCERVLALASNTLQSEQSARLRGQVREQLADPASVEVRFKGERGWAALRLRGSESLSGSGVLLELREGEWRIDRVGVTAAPP